MAERYLVRGQKTHTIFALFFKMKKFIAVNKENGAKRVKSNFMNQ